MYHHNTFIDSRSENVSLEYTSPSQEMFANLSGGRFANYSVKVDMSSRTHLLVCDCTLAIFCVGYGLLIITCST